MIKNKAAQLLGKLRGKTLTNEHQQRSAKKRWDDNKERTKASDRMKKYWIGWRKAKEEKENKIQNSVKKGFEMNLKI